MTDADISDVCFKLLDHCKIEYEYVENTYKHNKGIISREVESLEKLVDEIKETIENQKLNNENQKYMVCCDSKRIAEKIYLMLDKMGIIYTSDSEFDINLNETFCIIFSPKIIYGLDSNVRRKVFCAYMGDTISPSNMLQQINRERDIIELVYYFEKRSFRLPKYNNFIECEEYLQAKNKSALKT